MISKSNENKRAGEWAESESLYHIALSRYYYALYQKMIYIDEINGLGITSNLPNNGNISHKTFIQFFRQECHNKGVSGQQIYDLDKLTRLRVLRNKEEYKSKRFINNNNYLNKVKTPYIKINTVLDDIISRS